MMRPKSTDKIPNVEQEDKKKSFDILGFFKKKQDNKKFSVASETILREFDKPRGHKSMPEIPNISELTREDCVTLVPRKLKRIFGVDYSDQMQMETRKCPKIVIDLIDHLKKQNASQYEGIFRVSGNQTVMDQLVERFEKLEEVDLCKVKDIHAVAGLLKFYFRSMPSPLLTFNLFENFLKIPFVEDHKAKVEYIRNTINLLSPSRRFCFGLVLDLCFEISQNSRENLMTSTNLSVVFGVNLLKDKSESVHGKNANLVTRCFEDLIQYYPEYRDLFGDLTQYNDDNDKEPEEGEEMNHHDLRNLEDDLNQLI